MLRFHGSQGQEDVRADRDELAARRAPGGVPAHLAAAPRRLERLPPRGRGALRGARPRRRRRAARRRRRGTSTTCTSSARPERDRIAAALAEREIASAAYYVTPLHLQPALRYLGWEPGSLPETEKAAAENLALPLWGGHRRRGAGARRRRPSWTPSASRRRGREDADQPASAAAARGRLRDRRRRLVPRLPAPLRHRPARLLRALLQLGDPRARRRDQAQRLRALRLLQPLVALRLDAGHVGRCARRRRGEPRRLPRLQLLRRPRRRGAARRSG